MDSLSPYTRRKTHMRYVGQASVKRVLRVESVHRSARCREWVIREPIIRRDPADIKVVHQRRRDDEVRRGPVAGYRDIPDDRHPQQGPHVRVMRVRLEWVPKKDQEIE